MVAAADDNHRRRRPTAPTARCAAGDASLCETLPRDDLGRHVRRHRGRHDDADQGQRADARHRVHGGQVAVDATGQITCVGCNCAAGGETVITCPDGVDLARPHQHARSHHVHAEPAVHRRPASATTIASSGARASTATPRSRRRAARPPAQISLGRAALPDGRRDVDRRLGRPAGPAPQPRSGREHGRPAARRPSTSTRSRSTTRGGTQRTGDCNYGGTPTTAGVARRRSTRTSRTRPRASTPPRTTSSCARARRRYDTDGAGRLARPRDLARPR